MELSLEEARTELQKVQDQLDSKLREIEDLKNKQQISEREHNGTKADLRETEANLEEKEFSCPLKKGQLTKWDILYSCEYYNKVFTRRQQKKLRNTWRSLNTGNELFSRNT